jgi:hypothetical protein
MSNLAKNLFQELEKKDQEIVQSWAKEAYVIRNNETLSKPEKIKHLIVITNKNKIAFKFLKHFALLFKKHGWDQRNWASRLALAGLLVGVGVTGSQSAGIASAGIGIGVPVFILTSAGGALLGTIINETIKK